MSESVRVCTGCGAVSHAAVSCHVSVGLSFLACGALCGVASAEGHRLPLSTLRLHSLHTREEVGEVEDVREKKATDLSVWTLVSLVRALAVLCVRETCRVQTCGRVSERVRVCTGCVQSVTQLSPVTSVWDFPFLRAGRCVASRLRNVTASLP